MNESALTDKVVPARRAVHAAQCTITAIDSSVTAIIISTQHTVPYRRP